MMDIYRCQKKAQDEGFETATFDLVCPAGVKKCKWLDAYLGLFQIVGVEGFLHVRDAENYYCENFQSG